MGIAWDTAYSVVEEDLCPLAEIVSSLVEVASLVETSSPLDQVLLSFADGLVHPVICVIEFLFPPFQVSLTI